MARRDDTSRANDPYDDSRKREEDRNRGYKKRGYDPQWRGGKVRGDEGFSRKKYDYRTDRSRDPPKENVGTGDDWGDCFDNAGKYIQGCADRVKRESINEQGGDKDEKDWQHMRGGYSDKREKMYGLRRGHDRPPTSTNGHSDEEHVRGTNIRDDSFHNLPHYGLRSPDPVRMPLEERDFQDYMAWKKSDRRARRGLFRGKPKDWRDRRGDEDEGSMAV